MRLRGILSSKGRRIAYERNRDATAPVAPDGALSPALHRPSDGPGGTLICSCGGARYSPAAFAAHLAGRHMHDSAHGVYITANDPWSAAQEPERAASARHDAEAEWREKLLDRYFEQRRQRVPRIVAGTSDWMSET